MRIIDEKPELWPFILASLVMHALILLFLPKAILPSAFEEQPVEVFTVTEPPKAEDNWRIADIAKPAVEQKPKAAKFLGMYDSAVPEEMVGVGQRPHEDGGQKGRPKGGQKQRGADKGGGEQRKANKGRQPVSRDKLFAFNKSLFDGGGQQPAEESGNSASAGALDDFFPDFRRGANTYLNVLRYPGVEYFVRLKHAFRVTFNPEPPLRDYFSRNRVTRGSIDVVLGVSVARDGRLSELFVFRSSGIPSYDEEALRTVRASAPFATPPDKFLSDDGCLRMSWTFSVYL
ncbi:MAG: TonB family protein [Pseudomonadota bacterium]